MGTLYFVSCLGEKRLVKSGITKSEVGKEMQSYVRQLNPGFKIYYIRSWESQPGVTTYDVGSHSEFFEYVEGN